MADDAPGADREDLAPSGLPPAPLALYRKYRPATFAEVKGQDHVTEPLRQALRSGRVNHAYLFSGPRGCGKTSSARILARSLNCEQGPTPDPCGQCASCVALAPSGPGSIDVIEIDAASHGGVEDARDLRERAFYAPVAGRYKIYIIDEAHMVTSGGFNALLKLVEEPPPHLKFVFATTEPEKVIPTIRSRTHHYPFRLVPPAVLRELLEEILAAEGIASEPAVLPLVVRAGAGSVRDSLSVLDQLLAGATEEGLTYERTAALLGYTDDSLLDAMIDAFASGNGAQAFGTLDQVMESGHDPRRFATDLLDRLRDLIIVAAVPGAGRSGLLDAPADRLERMAAQAGRFGQAELTRAAAIVNEGLVQMRGAASPRLMLELTCAQVLLPGAHTDEKALLARIERLERAGPGPGPADPRPAQATAPGGGSSARSAGGAGSPSARSRGDGPRSGAEDAAATPAPAEQASRRPPVQADTAQAPAEERPAARRPQAPAGQSPPAPAQRPPAGALDVGALRQRWPDVLEAVRSERKVTAILLQSAAVQSLENDMATIAFAREGEARAFAAGGHEQVAQQVLSAYLGRKAQVRAVFNPGAAGTAAPARGEAQRAPAARPASPAGDSIDAGSPRRAATRAGGRRPQRPQPPPPSRGARPTAPGFAEEEWPDDAGQPAGPPADSLTGMELIRHQLGGEIIEEIDEG